MMALSMLMTKAVQHGRVCGDVVQRMGELADRLEGASMEQIQQIWYNAVALALARHIRPEVIGDLDEKKIKIEFNDCINAILEFTNTKV